MTPTCWPGQLNAGKRLDRDSTSMPEPNTNLPQAIKVDMRWIAWTSRDSAPNESPRADWLEEIKSMGRKARADLANAAVCIL